MSYLENAKQFVQDFFPYFIQFKHEWFNEDLDYIFDALCPFIDDYCNDKHIKINVECGATRIVFVGEDFVIKVDYGNKGKDYGDNKAELTGYEFAKKKGMSHLFAPITEYCYFSEEFYIMPRVTVAEEIFEAPDFYETLTEEESSFLQQYYEQDFHIHNYGMYNHKWILIDYAWHYIQ